MFRFVALGGVVVAALSSGCCWRPFYGSSGPALYNPPPAPLFPRLHPSNWGHPAAIPVVGPVVGPISGPVAGPDCPGCAAGGLPAGAIPAGAYPTGPMPPGAYPMAGPATVSPPPGMLSAGPQFSPMYFGQPNGAVPPVAAAPLTGSTQLPPPRAGEPPSAMPMSK